MEVTAQAWNVPGRSHLGAEGSLGKGLPAGAETWRKAERFQLPRLEWALCWESSSQVWGGQNILEQYRETEKSCACNFLNSRQAPETLTFHFHKGQQMSWMTITHMASWNPLSYCFQILLRIPIDFVSAFLLE